MRNHFKNTSVHVWK